MNWNSRAPIQWKWVSLKYLIQRSISFRSKEKLIEDELNYLRNVFIKVNNYPSRLVNGIINSITV